jgi:phage gpG-like protein
MGIEFNISGTEKLKQSAVKFKKAREGVRDAIYQLMLDYGNLSKATIQKDFLSGPNPEKLKVRSNRLRSSIRFQVQSSGDKFALIMGTDVPYAAIHEFGGITKPHEIRPKRKDSWLFKKVGSGVSLGRPFSTQVQRFRRVRSCVRDLNRTLTSFNGA